MRERERLMCEREIERESDEREREIEREGVIYYTI